MDFTKELTKDSLHRKYYEFWWNKSAPDNLCNYAWGLFLGVITFPLFLGRCMYEIVKSTPESSTVLMKTFVYAIWAVLTPLLSALLGIGVAYIIAYWEKTLMYTGGAVGFIIAVVIMFAVGGALKEPVSVGKDFIKAKKNKICPRINWK